MLIKHTNKNIFILVKGDGETEPHKNLAIWDSKTGEQITGFSQKNQVGWNVQWTVQENLYAKNVTNEVQFYDPTNISKGVAARLKIDNLKSFSLSPNKSGRQSVAVFVGEKGGAPAGVRLFDVAELNQTGNGTAKAQRTFFNADSVDFMWNADGKIY
jgi:translation initiation factor 2A